MSCIYFTESYQRSFGTFPLKGTELKQALGHAFEAGYRAIDTAQSYLNEDAVGQAIADAGLRREELCITTKVRPDNFREESFIPSVVQSLKSLDVEFVDVLLLHWPPVDGDVRPSLKLLQQAKDLGLARHIGVSNYTSKMMRVAAEVIPGPVVVNQVEFHPLLNQGKLLEAARTTNIPLSSYCSIARGEVFKYDLFADLARDYGKDPGQVVLRWILQKGVPINTMSRRPEHIRRNFDVMDFTLSSIDMAKIDALTATNLRLVTSENTPFAPAWD